VSSFTVLFGVLSMWDTVWYSQLYNCRYTRAE